MEIRQISKSMSNCNCSICDSEILLNSSYLYVRISGSHTNKICSRCSDLFQLFGDFQYLSNYENWNIARKQIETIYHLCKTFNIDINKLLNFYTELLNTNLIYYDKNIFSIIIQYILTFNCRQSIILNNEILGKIKKLELLVKNKYDTNLSYIFDQIENIFIFKFDNKLNQDIVLDLYNMSKSIFEDEIMYYFV